jgi:hypothetical protein
MVVGSFEAGGIVSDLEGGSDPVAAGFDSTGADDLPAGYLSAHSNTSRTGYTGASCSNILE